MDQRTPEELIERIVDLERQLAVQDIKLATQQANSEALQHQLDELRGLNAGVQPQADVNPFREELDAAQKRAVAERENHDATLKSLRPATATLTPLATKLFNAVLKHARKIHIVKRKLETTGGPNIEAWKELSGLLTLNRAVDEKWDIWKHTSPTDINGVSYTSIKCLTTIVELEPTKEAWLALGDGLVGGGEPDVPYTKKGCYLKALEIDPLFSEAWCSLGAILTEKGSNVTVDGKGSYNRFQCYKEALQHDSKNKHAWVGLGGLTRDNGRVSINGHEHSPQQCILQALVIDPRYPEAWNGLAGLNTLGEPIDVNGQKYSRSECLSMGELMAKVVAVEANTNNADVWLCLGRDLRRRKTGQEECDLTDKSPFSMMECIEKVLEINPRYAYAWSQAAWWMQVDIAASVKVGDTLYTADECLAQCHKLRESSVFGNGPVEVDGTVYTDYHLSPSM